MAPQSNQNTTAFTVATLGIATFAAMDAIMKDLGLAIGAYNALLWRTMLACMLAGLFFLWQGFHLPQKPVLRLHLWRGAITSVMAFLFFWGLKYVPLAEAIALSFIAPLIAMYLARVLLAEPIGAMAIVASVIGFSGALVIVAGKLGGDYGDNMLQGTIAILLSAVLYAYNLILQRQQAIVAQPLEIAFFQNCTVFGIYLLFAPFLAVFPPSTEYAGLLGAAVLGLASLMLLAWAYARAEARVLIPVEYTAFIWASLLGWVFFGEIVTVQTLMGTGLIVTGCIMAARQ